MRADKTSPAAKAAFFGLMVALSLIFSYIEFLIPINFGIPGVKLGLANLVVVVSMYTLSSGKAFAINILRIALSGLLFGTFMSLLYSLAGGLLSFGVMALFKKLKIFGISGVSILGGIFHNIGQLIAAVLVLGTPALGWYFPVLLFAGMVAGLLIGIVAGHSVSLLNKMGFAVIFNDMNTRK